MSALPEGDWETRAAVLEEAVARLGCATQNIYIIHLMKTLLPEDHEFVAGATIFGEGDKIRGMRTNEIFTLMRASTKDRYEAALHALSKNRL